MTFSQRHGYEKLPEFLKLDELSKKLRKELWESIYKDWERFQASQRQSIGEVINWPYVLRELDINYFQTEIEEHILANFLHDLKCFINGADCHYVLSAIELLSNEIQKGKALRSLPNYISQEFQKIFEKNLSAYTFVFASNQWHFIPTASENETIQVTTTLEMTEDKYITANEHILNAAKFLNNSQFIDSIRESISAVEATAKIVLNEPSITLTDAIKKIGQKMHLHAAVQSAIGSLYGFAGDGSGIRHAKKPNTDLVENERFFAQFFFGICTNLVSYLINISEKAKDK